MSAIATYLPTIRAILGDDDEDGIYDFSDYQVTGKIKAALNLGKVPGYSVDDDEVTPDLTPASDQKAYGLLIIWSCRLIVNKAVAESFRTRAFTQLESMPKELVDWVIKEVYDLENGEMAS